MTSFTEHLYASFNRVHGWLLSFIGIALSLAAFFFGADATIKAGWLVVALVAAGFLVALMSNAAYSAWKLARRGSPEVVQSIAPPQSNRWGLIRILVITPSELFAVESLVSIYAKDNDYERFIAVGQVLTKQENGFIQIGIIAAIDTGGGMAEKLQTNDASFLKTLLVKPSVPSYILNA